MTSPVFTPLQMFYSTSGLPLTDGYLYIGTASQNPQTNPIAVYWDAAGTIPAAQPIRTSGGYPVRNGSPATVFVLATDFSLIVRDKSSKLVFSRLSGNAFSSEWATYTPAGTGAVATTVQAKLRESVSVFDFMTAAQIADAQTRTASIDATAAFTAAQQASKFVIVPPGTYKLIGLRIYNQVNLIGQGYENTIFVQGSPSQPAINCTSDATVGQLLSLQLKNFGVTGHPSATVAAVKVEALGVYAVYRSSFDFIVGSSYRALEIQAYTANNVFWCDFKIDSVGTTDTSVVINGGTYNIFDFFLVTCATNKAVNESGFSNTFIRCVTEGQIASSGQSTVFIAPSIENLPGAGSLIGDAAIVLSGFNQKLISPTVNLDAASSAKVSYAITPFSGSSIENPQLLCTTALANPFATTTQKWTLTGPGRNNCANKMEVLYDGTADTKDLRKVAMVGDTSAFSSKGVAYAGRTVQYAALAAGAFINYSLKPQTDTLIFDQAGASTLINVSGYSGVVPNDGQTLTVYATYAITTLSWSIGSTITTALPTSMTAGQIARFVYESTANKWFPV